MVLLKQAFCVCECVLVLKASKQATKRKPAAQQPLSTGYNSKQESSTKKMVNSEQNNDIIESTTQLFASNDWWKSPEQQKSTEKEARQQLFETLNAPTSYPPIYSINAALTGGVTGTRFPSNPSADSLPSIDETTPVSTDMSTTGNSDGFQQQLRTRHSSAVAAPSFDYQPSTWPTSGAFAPVDAAAKQRHSSYSTNDHTKLITMSMTSAAVAGGDVFAAMQPIGGGGVAPSNGRSRAYSEGSLNVLSLDTAAGKPSAATGGFHWPTLAAGRPGSLGQYRNGATVAAAAAQQQVPVPPGAGQFLGARAAVCAAAAAAAATAAAAQQAQAGSRYKTELCRPFEESGRCKYGEKCQFAHGQHELREMQRHPKYKTELCRTYHTTGYCPYGPRCHFIHEKSRDSNPSTAKMQQQQQQTAAGGAVQRSLMGSNGSSPIAGTTTTLQQLSLIQLQEEINQQQHRLFSVPRPVPLNGNNLYYNSVAASPSSSYSPPGFESLQSPVTPPWGSGSPSFGGSMNGQGDDQVFASPPRSPAASSELKQKFVMAPAAATTATAAATAGGVGPKSRLSVFRSLSKTEG